MVVISTVYRTVAGHWSVYVGSLLCVWVVFVVGFVVVVVVVGFGFAFWKVLDFFALSVTLGNLSGRCCFRTSSASISVTYF